MTKKKRFGISKELHKGLSETISVVENGDNKYRSTVIPISKLELDPNNPRKLLITLRDIYDGINKDDPNIKEKKEELGKLKELASTIEKSGIINPITAYKLDDHYRVVTGERRTLASIISGKKNIDARIFNAKPTEFDLKLIQWVENTAREDLTLWERLENIREIVDSYKKEYGAEKVTNTELCKITGLSNQQIGAYLAVLNGPDDLKETVAKSHINNLDKAVVIANVISDKSRKKIIQKCIEGASLRALKQLVSNANKKKNEIDNINKKRGRKAKRVHMGYTDKTSVIKMIVESVINYPEFTHYAQDFSSVNWSNIDSATNAFKKLVACLENEIL